MKTLRKLARQYKKLNDDDPFWSIFILVVIFFGLFMIVWMWIQATLVAAILTGIFLFGWIMRKILLKMGTEHVLEIPEDIE